MPVAVPFKNFDKSVPEVLDALGARNPLAGVSRILLKPNLVTIQPHPVTTAPDFCRAVIRHLRSFTTAEIVIAEGTGDPSRTTLEVFEQLGYQKLAAEFATTLIDLNTAPLKKLARSDCPRFPEMVLPEIAFTHFIISLPVLKAHSLAGITGSLKNMMGFAPPAHYSGCGGIWNKAEFHRDIHQAIVDLNRYRKADLTLMDASVGMPDYHLGGRNCEPPINQLIAGFDPLAVDRKAAELLGLDWRTIPHLTASFEDAPGLTSY
jgi:uncharacterized protein (DUF362 family)